ncbi:HAMP domain-containing histidine kinase [Fructobacillus sp. M2-14]|uniref:histidine kinase n=2 Tax=Fructobacillus broussonetiae TaxID=2713173 RepID=A0ABS5R291_9LACO|nr:HAMP domain-containing histidine kinase [Fructobacillus broussonetiae]
MLAEDDLEFIPDFQNLSSLEHSYTELLEQVVSQKSRQKEKNRLQTADLKDYYALWAHQIKVPLSVLDLMNQTGTVDQKQTKEQLFLVNQYMEMLLSFIRLQDFNQDMNLKEISARSLVMKTLKNYKVWFIQKELTLSVSESDFTFVSDSKWLTFVLEQIIYNAIKYTKTGGLTIDCTSDQKIIIQDTGIGIDPADLPQVFHKGYTGFNGRVQDNASGLGLYLVKSVLDKLGHQVKIESTVGVGTTVTIDCRQKQMR